MSRLGILLHARCWRTLPLPWVRALGWLLGWLLYCVVVPRRRVVQRQPGACASRSGRAAQRARVARAKSSCAFAQSWLDRSWLWHGDAGGGAPRGSS